MQTPLLDLLVSLLLRLQFERRSGDTERVATRSMRSDCGDSCRYSHRRSLGCIVTIGLLRVI